jgi:hypothetical protein
MFCHEPPAGIVCDLYCLLLLFCLLSTLVYRLLSTLCRVLLGVCSSLFCLLSSVVCRLLSDLCRLFYFVCSTLSVVCLILSIPRHHPLSCPCPNYPFSLCSTRVVFTAGVFSVFLAPVIYPACTPLVSILLPTPRWYLRCIESQNFFQ